MPLEIDRDFVTDLAVRLVRTPSVNPAFDPASRGEAAVAAVTGAAMEALGMEVTRRESDPDRVSMVGRVRGSGTGRSLMLNAHYDTVGVAGMSEPFSGRVADGRLHGRGAYDMKGSLAASLGAVKALRDAGVRLAGDLVVAAVADEEEASRGTADLIAAGVLTDGAVVTEPTGLSVCVAHKGFVWARFRTGGRAAHGSRPDLGVDANLAMAPVLWGLRRLAGELADRDPHPLLGPPSLHVGRVDGGTAPSVYAAECRVTVEWRTLPGTDPGEVTAELEALAEAARSEGSDVSLETLLVRPPFEADREDPVVAAVGEAVSGAGEPVRFTGEGPWMDSALLADAGVETVVLGPAGAGAHADEEWVDLASVHRLAGVLADAAARYCGVAGSGEDAPPA